MDDKTMTVEINVREEYLTRLIAEIIKGTPFSEIRNPILVDRSDIYYIFDNVKINRASNDVKVQIKVSKHSESAEEDGSIELEDFNRLVMLFEEIREYWNIEFKGEYAEETPIPTIIFNLSIGSRKVIDRQQMKMEFTTDKDGNTINTTTGEITRVEANEDTGEVKATISIPEEPTTDSKKYKDAIFVVKAQQIGIRGSIFEFGDFVTGSSLYEVGFKDSNIEGMLSNEEISEKAPETEETEDEEIAKIEGTL